MKLVKFNPKTDLIIPVGLYTDDKKFYCNLIYPVLQPNGSWGFPDKWRNLARKKVYNVFSPSIIPLPPQVRLYYTVVKASEPIFITSIKEVYDSFDVNGLLVDKGNSGPDKKIGIIFGAYKKPVKNTVALYSHVKQSQEESLYLDLFPPSQKRDIPGLWKSKFHAQDMIISPIFFIDCDCIGFSLENDICYPSTETKQTIDECSAQIQPEGIDVHTPVPFKVNFDKEDSSSRNSAFTVTFIAVLVSCVIAIIVGIYFRYR